MVIGESFWIFGYGSLIWRPDFPYKRRYLGYIKGFIRRFHQLNTTHRGTPENPGRVVTIIPSDPDTRVWGYAYEIVDPVSIKTVKEYLFDREVKNGGYDLARLRFYHHSVLDENLASQEDTKSWEVMTYIADTNSHLYSDNVSISVQALDISSASGWCGPNSDYLFRLIEFMHDEVPPDMAKRDDSYLFELGNLVETFMKTQVKRKPQVSDARFMKTGIKCIGDQSSTDLVVDYLVRNQKSEIQLDSK